VLTDQELRDQLPHVLAETDFEFSGYKYKGKVRDSYVEADRRWLVTSDRLSAFDVVLTTIPFKGQVLNTLAQYWFGITGDIVTNHLLDIPHPNVMLARNCNVLPVEVVVRSYLTGSAWRDYKEGKSISGITLPDGLKMSQKLPELILTPATKAEKGDHDEPISREEILGRGLVEKRHWEFIEKAAFALFSLGEQKAKERGLLFVDTKYEFGLLDDKVILADEIHTLDSSRYWVEETYQERFNTGAQPEMLDKEPTRQWLLDQGYSGIGKAPIITEEHRIEIAKRYISACEWITGEEFKPVKGNVLPEIERLIVGNQ